MAEAKPMPVNPGERTNAIAAPKNSLASMLARGMTDSDIRRQAPSSHHEMDRRMGIRSEDEVRALNAAGLDQPLPRAPVPQTPAKAVRPRWQRGDQARDTKKGKVVTILAARVKVNEAGIPYHRVAADGETWLAKDTKLKPVS